MLQNQDYIPMIKLQGKLIMKTCCIIGHRDFKKTKELELKVKSIVLDLIEKEEVTCFLFGSKSRFND